MSTKDGLTHPCEIQNYIPLSELWFRLNIHKASWEHHVNNMGRVPKDLVVRTPKGRILEKYKYPRGDYVKWELAAELLMHAFQDAQLLHTEIRLRALGFSMDLSIRDPKEGITRMNTLAIKDWKACVKEERGTTDTVPRSFKRGNIGKRSYTASGVVETDYTEKRSYTEEFVRMETVPIEDKKPTKKAVDTAKKSVEDLENIDFDEGVDMGTLLGEITDIDFNDPEQVAMVTRKAKFLKEITATQKEMVALAKISNTTIDIDEVEKLLSGTMLAFRTTLDQLVPKTTAEIYGAIVTELVRADPSIQKRLADIDMSELNNKVRKVFDKGAYELSELLNSFQGVEEE